MYYSNAPEENEKLLEILKNRTANVIFEETSFIVCAFSNSEKPWTWEKEKQKIHFNNANRYNEKV